MMLKLKLILAFILALILGSNAFAETTSLALDSELETVKTPISMIWPMLPGESVNDVARLFYPKNVVMQRLFVRKTLRLNTGTQHNLIPTERFEEPTLLVIPTLKSLSKKRHVSQSSAERPVKHRLQITTDIENAQEGVPAKLKEEYAFLVSKNELLNQQLMALKDKIVFLETKLNNLKLIWEKNLNYFKE